MIRTPCPDEWRSYDESYKWWDRSIEQWQLTRRTPCDTCTPVSYVGRTTKQHTQCHNDLKSQVKLIYNLKCNNDYTLCLRRKVDKKQTCTKTETCKLCSTVFWIFLPNVIKIDRYNFELYRFKVRAFFSETQCSAKMTSYYTRNVQMKEESESGIRKWEEVWFKTRAEHGERGAAMICDWRLFHRRAAATGNALSSISDNRNSVTHRYKWKWKTQNKIAEE